MPGRVQSQRETKMTRSKRQRPASLDESVSDEEFEVNNTTPRIYKLRKRKGAKKRRKGSLTCVKETVSESEDFADEKCEKCGENNRTVTLSEKYRSVEKEMEKLFNFMPRACAPEIPVVSGTSSRFCRSKNVMDFLRLRQLRGCPANFSQNVSTPVIDLISNLQLYRTASPFDRRVTAMTWHPARPNILAVGSKGGDIIIWDTDQIKNETMIQGIGAGGSVQAVKFWPYKNNVLLTSSIDGTVKLHDLQEEKTTILGDTFNCYDYWYCCVDVNPARRMVVAGDNIGTLKMITPEGNKIMSSRLHKNKITHAEFHLREDWLLCTASTDSTVKLWDVRRIRDRSDCLESLKHEKPINSAYFSLTDGCRLLTTDQGNEIRVYRAPMWQLETTIHHPHRFFQHITPIKANWHPYEDLIVVGRYPDPKFPGYTSDELRSTDVFNAETGKKVVELYDPTANGIKSLHRFNILGDRLAAAMGYSILLWTRKEHAAEKQEELLQKFKEEHGRNKTGGQGRSTGSRSQPRQRKKKGQNDDDDDDDDVGKLKMKLKNKSKKKM